ncbi:MAG: hypothetical protein A2X52_16125 [Candidatus Rokubacteria bacterium GWC2_70_16]|nr:MAG: hypothetical protein A2X52_16125 [Candidatus Rokubacteria bacterium GWC2_70_16]
MIPSAGSTERTVARTRSGRMGLAAEVCSRARRASQAALSRATAAMRGLPRQARGGTRSATAARRSSSTARASPTMPISSG